MDINEKSLGKLLNILGKKVVKDYYGIDVKFQVETLNVNSDNYKLHLSTEPPLPEVLRVVGENCWCTDRYATILDLSFVLENQLRYLSQKEASILFTNRPINTIGKKLNDLAWNPNKWREEYPELFIEMEGNGNFIDTTLGATFVELVDGRLEYTDYKITDIDNEDWWDALTPKDKEILTKTFG
jgi:hypothetical protein